MNSDYREDLLFNINFVQAIERHPCIWNCYLPEYNKRNVTEKAWELIAKEMNHSVSNCRERWRNLRGAFLRTLKNSESGSDLNAKKKYYLNKHLQFLLPYTKYKTASENVETLDNNENSGEITVKFEEHYTELEDLPLEPGNESHQIAEIKPGCSKKRKVTQTPEESSNDAEESVLDWMKSKREQGSMDENSNLLFLRSLLPDIMKMTSKQNRRFRQKVIGLIDDILDDADIEPS